MSSCESTPTVVEPESGYTLTQRDFDFIGVGADQVAGWNSGSCPLGMTSAQYHDFKRGLFHALSNEGLTAADFDVRLQGSSARFFSSGHKRVPETKEKVFEMLIARRSSSHPLDEQIPTEAETNAAAMKLFEQWPPEGPRPSRRPFDSMFRAGLETGPSDYDIQISSDRMFEHIKQELRHRNLNPDLLDLTHRTYAFVRKEYAEEYFRYVSHWCGRVGQDLGRPVTWALFPGKGPKKDKRHPRLSSHHRKSDWILTVVPDT